MAVCLDPPLPTFTDFRCRIEFFARNGCRAPYSGDRSLEVLSLIAHSFQPGRHRPETADPAWGFGHPLSVSPSWPRRYFSPGSASGFALRRFTPGRWRDSLLWVPGLPAISTWSLTPKRCRCSTRSASRHSPIRPIRPGNRRFSPCRPNDPALGFTAPGVCIRWHHSRANGCCRLPAFGPPVTRR